MMVLRTAAAIAATIVLAGCGLPSDGPATREISTVDNPTYPKPSYLVVDVDEKVINTTGQYRPQSFASFFKMSTQPPSIRLAKGDKVQVNIFEAGADGLFSSSTAKATQIEAVIDESGRIFVPYVGAVQAAGSLPETLRSTIESALADKAIQPQVQVLVAQSAANSATVIGKVGVPSQVPISAAETRILDLIATVGGTTGETYNSEITLRRGNKVATANLEDLFDNESNNVPVRPGDVVLVSDTMKSFTVFGAANAPQEFKFESRMVTLAEGLARAGGLNDVTADARGVFLFRFEPDHIAKALDERAVTAAEGSMVPVIYKINLKDPKSFFLMKMFELRDEDVIYISDHPAAELAKFLQILSPAVNTAVTVATLNNRF